MKAYGVKVWQNRHPGIRAYIAGLLRAAGREMKRGILKRITFVVKSATTNLPLERFIFDVDYMDLSMFPSEAEKDSSTLLRAPSRRQMKLNFQAFLTRLAALETGLTDNDPDEDLTYAVIITCDDHEPDLQPVIDYNDYEGNVKPSERQPPYHPPEGPALWAPATRVEGLHSSQMKPRPPVILETDESNSGKGKGKARVAVAGEEDGQGIDQSGRNPINDAGRTPEGLRPIRSLETGVIDVSVASLLRRADTLLNSIYDATFARST
ncbi:hypothetical protein QFC21_001239 [Naganishia friedmannii]|uniref:Uncharacterized protein n=1 Tax=Naganishia friedmannii TaxID=89922 RepID=A0ACC2W4A2_9TREE|nr:hypothetical protein QFC21_001239 [Naganishia friedmannii]